MSSNYGSISQPSGSGSSNNFSPTEFLILKESICNNIITIKKQYHKLEKNQRIIGSKKDSNEVRNKIQSIEKATNDVIKTTSTEIKKLNSIVKFSSSDKTHQLMLEKIVSEFHMVVQKYLQSEKSLTLKMKKTLLVNLNEDSDDDDVNLSLQQKQLMQANLNFEKELLVDREQQFQKIESDVIDINQIMTEISTLINEQGESVQTIDNSISQVAEDVEGGVSELQKAASHQQKFRRKVLIIFIIALIIALFVVFSLYSKLKN